MADDTTEDRMSSSGEEHDETDAFQLKKDSSTLRRQLKSLDYFTVNGLRQVFQILDANGKGSLAKTQLQVIYANICNVLNLKYTAEELSRYNSEKLELLLDEFIEYVDSELLPKVCGGKVDLLQFDKISWTIIAKEKSMTKLLSEDELFKLWLAYNKINIDGTTTIDIEEAALLLQEFMKAIGTPWTRGSLDDFTENNNLTFWELVTCLETKYINNTPKSVYLEGLEAITSIYVHEVIKTGTLTKKGHRIKSMKERWFVLIPSRLSYHGNKNNHGKMKGFIAINKFSKVESIPDSKNMKCRFVVICGNKSIQYEMEADNQKTKNEWITSIQQCIDMNDSTTPLMTELMKRSNERKYRRTTQAEEERQHLEQEELIRRQLEELELIRQARDQAQAQAESEAALLEEERKRREELEALKAEYEKLLEEEKQARKAESIVRSRQQEILEEEMLKRQELEKIKAEQDRILEEERKGREGLEEVSKEQAKALEEEREQLRSLDEARLAAEAKVAEMHAKLEASEDERRAAAEEVEAAKQRTRMLKMPVGLARALAERERLRSLDEARQAAEAKVAETHAKLEASEDERTTAAEKVEAAKQRTRMLKMPVGLARALALEQKGLITHRGLGSFVDEDFSKTPLYLSGERRPAAVNKRELPGDERTQIVEINLVKPSMGKATFEGTDSK